MGHCCIGRLAFLGVLWALALAACNGGGTPADHAASPNAAAERGRLLQDTFTAYPRLVRLAHQPNAALNGRIVASVTQTVGGVWMVGLHASDDDGASFVPLGTIADAAFATGLCCGSLFELPQAVGGLPAGTLLYAAAVGGFAVGQPMQLPLYRSDDGGATFARIEGAQCGQSAAPRAPNYSGPGVWEPEFFIAADGSLACVHSDESEPNRSQVIKLARTVDGVSWTVPQTVVAGPADADRPGMAVVRRLPSGRYSMSFEVCGPLACEVRWKVSEDGLDWGPLGTLGTRPQTVQGQHFRHAPTHLWIDAAATPHGTLALIGQIVSIDGAVDAEHNGRVLLINRNADGAGAWDLVASPIGLPLAPAVTNWCQNYSTALLAGSRGDILMMQTDGSADASCRARFGSGPLANGTSTIQP